MRQAKSAIPGLTPIDALVCENGSLYAATLTGNLYTLNLTTGQATFVAATPGRLYGMAYLLYETLTVTTAGNGTVTSTDGFINCPGTCSHTYPAGTQVTLNSTPGKTGRSVAGQAPAAELAPATSPSRRTRVLPACSSSQATAFSSPQSRPAVWWIPAALTVRLGVRLCKETQPVTSRCRRIQIATSSQRGCVLSERYRGAARGSGFSIDLAHGRSPTCCLHHELPRRADQGERCHRARG